LKIIFSLCLAFLLLPASARAQDAGVGSPGPGDAGAAEELTPPRLLQFVEAPAPPELAERKRVTVVLTLDVDATGAVTSVQVAQSGGEAFDRAAVAAAQQFHFEPGRVGGVPVPVRLTYQYRFVLRPPAAAPARPIAPPGVPFSGVVRARGDRVPVPGVAITVDDGPRATTGDDGRFAFDAVPPGPHTVRLRGATIGRVDSPITLQPGKATSVTWYVDVVSRYETVVRGRRPIQETVEQTLAGEELRHIPGTQGDTLKAVQNLPGVARSPFGFGLLIVWGSAPFDTRTYVDGVYIPTLYHFGGLRSTVNSEIVDSLTFLPGGYGVEYGRGLGGVIEVGTRRPREDGVHGYVQLDLFDAAGLLEAKLTPSLSFVVSARRSWVDAFLPLFTTSDFQLSPRYWDYQGKLRWRAGPRDEVELFLFGSDDSIELKLVRPDPLLSAQFNSHIYYHRSLVRWLHRFVSGAALTVVPSVGYDVPFQFTAVRGNTPIAVDITTFSYGLRALLQAPLGRFLRLDTGLDFEGNRWPITALANASGGPREGDPGAGFRGSQDFVSDDFVVWQNRLAPFAALTATLAGGRLVVTPQLRLDVLDERASYASGAPAVAAQFAELEPRATVRYRLTPRLWLKGAAGLYHQAPQATDLSQTFGNPHLEPEEAEHYVAGVEIALPWALHLDTSLFWKQLDHLIVRGENPGDPPLVNDGVGRVYGGELILRRELSRRFFGWIAYTLSRSERRDHPDQSWRLFQYDQTHILTLVTSAKLSRGWQLGLRFRYVTGNPYTPVTGAYYDVTADRYRPLFGATYSARVPAFNALDLRVDKTWTWDRFRMALYLDLQNVYNNRAAEGVTYNFDFRRSDTVNGLPFFPIAGVRGDF
jgi:TonB family protein